MKHEAALKAISDDTRRKIVSLLLRSNHCVRSLAKRLGITESAVSQHLKVLRDAGLINGEKKGHFMHYDVNRDVIRELADEIKELAEVKKEDACKEKDNCHAKNKEKCQHHSTQCSKEVKEFCHGESSHEKHGCKKHHGEKADE